MAKNDGGLLEHLLANAAVVEQGAERRWREFAAVSGDDDEVRSIFEASAVSAILNGQRVRMRLAELGAPQTTAGQELNTALQAASQIGRSATGVEERLMHNLIIASAEKAGQCALYKSLGAAAAAAGDAATEDLAKEIEENEQRMLEMVEHLLPSRSKIAFNMLTVSEVDPAVETKAKDDRPES